MTVTKVPTDPNMTPEVRRFLDDLSRKNSFAALTVTDLTVSNIKTLVAFALGLTVTTGGVTITDGGLTVTAGSVSFPAGSIANAALANAPAFSKSYSSAAQAITSAGTLTLAHGLGAAPALVQCRLQNQTAEKGYSIGDLLVISNDGGTGAIVNTGMSMTLDATNINILFGSAGTVFCALNKTSGAGTTLTNANWKLLVSAWA